MRERLLDRLRVALSELLAEAGDTGELPALSLDVPRQTEHGDFASNAAMVLAKRLRKPPRAIAERLVELLGDGDGLLARCFQHETDHLNGKLYIDHLNADLRAELESEMTEAEWYGRNALDPKSRLWSWDRTMNCNGGANTATHKERKQESAQVYRFSSWRWS